MDNGMIGLLLAISGGIGTALGVAFKYMIDRKNVSLREVELSLREVELLDRRRGDFHKEIKEELDGVRERERELIEENKELRHLLWRAIPLAEESVEEAESNLLHFAQERKSE